MFVSCDLTLCLFCDTGPVSVLCYDTVMCWCILTLVLILPCKGKNDYVPIFRKTKFFRGAGFRFLGITRN